MFPLIPLLGLTGLLGGAGTLLWYSRLSKEDRARADRIAEEYASDYFDKARWQLTRSEEKHILKLAKRDFEAIDAGRDTRPA